MSWCIARDFYWNQHTLSLDATATVGTSMAPSIPFWDFIFRNGHVFKLSGFSSLERSVNMACHSNMPHVSCMLFIQHSCQALVKKTSNLTSRTALMSSWLNWPTSSRFMRSMPALQEALTVNKFTSHSITKNMQLPETVHHGTHEDATCRAIQLFRNKRGIYSYFDPGYIKFWYATCQP